MPLYEYACEQCEHTFEALVFDGDAVECPECAATRGNGPRGGIAGGKSTGCRFARAWPAS